MSTRWKSENFILRTTLTERSIESYFTLSRLSVHSIFHTVKAVSWLNISHCQCCKWTKYLTVSKLSVKSIFHSVKVVYVHTMKEWKFHSTDNFDWEKYWVTDNLDTVKYCVRRQLWQSIPEVGLAVRFTYQHSILFFNQVWSKSPIKHDISSSGMIKDMSFQSIYVSIGKTMKIHGFFHVL
jgi:hypothetical protein